MGRCRLAAARSRERAGGGGTRSVTCQGSRGKSCVCSTWKQICQTGRSVSGRLVSAKGGRKAGGGMRFLTCQRIRRRSCACTARKQRRYTSFSEGAKRR